MPLETKKPEIDIEVLREFLSSFELVFRDDWEFTLGILKTTDGSYIADSGTFIDPNVTDESNNWANRGHLLDVYRRVRSMVDA